MCTRYHCRAVMSAPDITQGQAPPPPRGRGALRAAGDKRGHRDAPLRAGGAGAARQDAGPRLVCLERLQARRRRPGPPGLGGRKVPELSWDPGNSPCGLGSCELSGRLLPLWTWGPLSPTVTERPQAPAGPCPSLLLCVLTLKVSGLYRGRCDPSRQAAPLSPGAHAAWVSFTLGGEPHRGSEVSPLSCFLRRPGQGGASALTADVSHLHLSTNEALMRIWLTRGWCGHRVSPV